MKFAKIAATGSYLPSKILTNHDVAKMVDTSDEWIVQRTGIKQRHIATEQDTVVSMATAAAKAALQTAGLQSKDLDMIIVATCSAEYAFPSVACLLQAELGMPSCPAFDMQAACSGFIYALSVATQFIATQQCKRVLLVGSEAMSRVVDWKDRSSCILFGDGAGAMILEAADAPGILATHLQADGTCKDPLYLPTGGKVQMQGNTVFRLAVKWLSEVAKDALDANKMQPSDIDWVIPHQANIRIIQSTVKALGIPLEKVVVTVDEHANTSAASIPLALDLAIRDGRVQRGQTLLLEAFGGGLTWGSALVRY
ncbi:MAG TPA: beta-ketoacyl-ACP synthase III [Gammaproteobacteria bacterium]|nr:beta-ketoacyl-ACP synthase III [Gammaproteobacteria bacterium]